LDSAEVLCPEPLAPAGREGCGMGHGNLYVWPPLPRSMVLDDDEPPRRKRDPLKSFRDPTTERESRYKERLRIEAENRRRAWLERMKKKETEEEKE
jgi:hypothetical protein